MAQEISLKSLLVPSKTVEVEFPGFPGFAVELNYLSRDGLINLRKKSTKTIFKGRQTTEEFNEDLFLELYVDAAIKGWTGLKFKYINLLVPADVSQFDEEDELGYSKENALMLMKNSTDFDSFVSERVNDLGNFSKSS
jgi:hypothetical protein